MDKNVAKLAGKISFEETSIPCNGMYGSIYAVPLV